MTPPAGPPLHQRWLLRAIQQLDRARLRRLCRRHPGVEIHPDASSNLASAQWTLAPGARVRVDAGVVTERRPGALRIFVGEGGVLEIGADTWLWTDLEQIVLVVFPGGRLEIARDGWLSGCHLSAKSRVTLERGAMVGPGSRVYDGDQHDLDAEHKEQVAPVTIGEWAWTTTDSTVLRGVTIGAHAVVGARSLVLHDVPPHRVAFGSPATVRGEVGDRTGLR